jgi:hypothetical protein
MCNVFYKSVLIYIIVYRNYLENVTRSLMWWFTPVNPSTWCGEDMTLRQGDKEFKARLGYTASGDQPRLEN